MNECQSSLSEEKYNIQIPESLLEAIDGGRHPVSWLQDLISSLTKENSKTRGRLCAYDAAQSELHKYENSKKEPDNNQNNQ